MYGYIHILYMYVLPNRYRFITWSPGGPDRQVVEQNSFR